MANLLKDTNIPIKIARISTIAFFVETQLKKQILDIKSAGYDITIICSKGTSLEIFLIENQINYICINIARNISIISDLISLIKLYKVFRIHSFDIVHSTTPKAGLLVTIAGLLANTPIRLHTFTGQVWMNLKGFKKYILKFSDRIVIKFNTQCYADGLSQVRFLLEEGLIQSENQIKVFGEGSIAGVDLSRFDLKYWSLKKKELLKQNGLDNRKKIIFIGRITFDKGIVDLIEAFLLLMKRSRNYNLILIGPIENDLNLISEDILKEIKSSKDIFHFDYSPSPEIFYTMGDIFCLPSHREGFGTTVIEAASMGLATVGTKINGLVDSILENKSGILVPVKDSFALANAIEEILEDDIKRKIMSNYALKRAKTLYDSNIVNKYVVDEYFLLADNTFKFIKG